MNKLKMQPEGGYEEEKFEFVQVVVLALWRGKGAVSSNGLLKRVSGSLGLTD